MGELNTNYIGHGILGEIWSVGYLLQISWGNRWYQYLPPVIVAIGSSIMIHKGLNQSGIEAKLNQTPDQLSNKF